MQLTILGGGNTAFATAARLTLFGHDVVLYELPAFSAMLDPMRRDRIIHLKGVGGEGPAKIYRIATDIEEALAESALILLIVPAYAHAPFAEVCVPHLRAGQTVVLMPGTLGSLAWAKTLSAIGKAGVTLAEVDTAPYVCRKTAPDTATIWGVVNGLGLGVFPAVRTDVVKPLLEPLFPGIRTYPDVMACGLSAMNPVVHPAGVLMNAGRIEYAKGEFCFYEEGVTPSVVKVIMAVDAERRAIGNALGYTLTPVHEAFADAGFGPRGDLWATINGSWMLTRLKAPGSLESRWLTEDVPYGLAAWHRLGALYGVEAPTLRALVDLAGPVMGFDGWKAGRGPEELGIAGLSREKLTAYLQEG
ncbi:MAG: NAD/NADP octopine/nopaline dehydrogenase family protein [candidate division Zixibacteria bacterium]|nr:NAD/NADP octopine/nopaline dehydrogenase family protein [candidate division Zixibacteria bacterium]